MRRRTSKAAPTVDGAPAALDHNACYRAISSRDRRFDGKFFTAVRTTGIYCRPICPAQTPKRANVQFFVAAAAAEAAGFRPCLRCRPEAAPGSPAWLGTSATVARALRLIDAGALDDAAVEQLATRVGIGERHLRRLFVAHVGAAPLAVAQTRRVQLAKQLLDETRLPMTRIAMDAGFGSLRRFNFAMRATYGRNPSELRKEKAGADPSAEFNGVLSLKLGYRPPFAWESVLAFLALRATPGVECVQEGTFLRRVRHGRVSSVVKVEHRSAGACIVVSVPADLSPALAGILASARRTFDVTADPQTIARTLGADPALAARVRRNPGIRVPGAWEPFETAVRAIVGQQISVRGATTIMGRIAERWGVGIGDGTSGPPLLFPAADVLAGADLERIGMPTTRAHAVTALAKAVASETIALDGSRPLEATIAALEALPGVGPWTAAYIAMRALGEPDAFPAGDLVVRRALAKRKDDLPSIAEVGERAEQWRPWRAYAALHLWTSDAAPARETGVTKRPERTKTRKAKEASRATAA